MPKIKMIRSENGSPTGIAVLRYMAGETYDVPESLAEVFIGMGVAQPVSTRTIAPEGGAVIEPPKDTTEPPKEVGDRKDIIVTAITAIYDEVQEKPELKEGLFTDSGYPRVEAVRERVKMEVSATEIKSIWDDTMNEIDKDEEKLSIWNRIFAGKDN